MKVFWLSTGNPNIVVSKMSQVLPVLRKKCLLCKTQYMVHFLLKVRVDLHGTFISLWTICSCGWTVWRTRVFGTSLWLPEVSPLLQIRYVKEEECTCLRFKCMKPKSFTKQVICKRTSSHPLWWRLKKKKSKHFLCMICPRRDSCA